MLRKIWLLIIPLGIVIYLAKKINPPFKISEEWYVVSDNYFKRHFKP